MPPDALACIMLRGNKCAPSVQQAWEKCGMHCTTAVDDIDGMPSMACWPSPCPHVGSRLIQMCVVASSFLNEALLC